LVEQGKAYDQDAVFISKVVKDGAGPNSRPGVEIYFKQKMTPAQMAAVTAKLRQYGVDGFTYVTDMRFNDRVNVQAKAGGAETAGLNGLRFQYIPEFDDAFNAADQAQGGARPPGASVAQPNRGREVRSKSTGLISDRLRQEETGTTNQVTGGRRAPKSGV